MDLEKCGTMVFEDKPLTLVFTSSGIREGAIEKLRVGDHTHIERMDGRLTVYNGDPERYVTFISPEACEDSAPRRMTAWLHEERTSISPYGASDQRAVSTPERISIEKLDVRVVAERRAPKDSFAGHQMSTPWDELHRAYFYGEALWTYLTTPFLLAGDDVRVEEGEPWHEGEETWRVLRAYFP